MAKRIPCKLIGNTRLGRISPPMWFRSISEAVKFAKGSPYYAYYVYDMDGKLKKSGFCG